MIHTFKFKPKFSPDRDGAVLGTIPNGRILESKLVFDDGEDYWLVVVDDNPTRGDPVEVYLKKTGS